MVLGIKKPDNVPGSAAPAIIIGIFVAFGGILFGYDTGSINGILGMDYFKKEFSTHQNSNGDYELDSGQKSLIVSILSLGTFFGKRFPNPPNLTHSLNQLANVVFRCSYCCSSR